MNLEAELRVFRDALKKYDVFLKRVVFWDVGNTVAGIDDSDRSQEERLRERLQEAWGRLCVAATQLPEVSWRIRLHGQVFNVVEQALSTEIDATKMEFLNFAIEAVTKAVGVAGRPEVPSAAPATTRATASRTIFIGHGRSSTWGGLKELLVERLGLDVEDFNSEPTAGIATKERLLHMLEDCCFAFLVMTAEDEHGDGTKHARENVVHEIGLFQGRYGFERAIVVLEDGCAEFSNIFGIGQIRFPKGNIMAKSEEIRRVLEREDILTALPPKPESP